MLKKGSQFEGNYYILYSVYPISFSVSNIDKGIKRRKETRCYIGMQLVKFWRYPGPDWYLEDLFIMKPLQRINIFCN